MIEFKAECGHTVRAKDEDAGKTVRCSYCGREARAPEKTEGREDLEYLFSEVEKTGVYEAPSNRERVRRMRGKPTRVTLAKKRGEGFNPFSFVLKLCYVGLIVFVLIYVGNKLHDTIVTPKEAPRPVSDGEDKVPTRPDGPRAPPSGVGLLRPALSPGGCGLYVNSVPGGAEVFITAKGAVRRSESVFRCGSEELKCTLRSGEAADRLSAGQEYDVFVALRINNPNLMKLPGYAALRRAYRKDGDDRLFGEYFLPDGAVDVMTEAVPNRPMMVIRKYECKVFDRTWTPVIALFLPELPLPELLRYVPRRQTFGFDEAEVQAELEFHGIGSTDRKYMIDILRRIGIVPYWDTDDGLYHVFAISLTDGSIYRRPGSLKRRGGAASGWDGADAIGTRTGTAGLYACSTFRRAPAPIRREWSHDRRRVDAGAGHLRVTQSQGQTAGD